MGQGLVDKICSNCHYWETFSCWHWSLSQDHLPNDTCKEFSPLDPTREEVRVPIELDKQYLAWKDCCEYSEGD